MSKIKIITTDPLVQAMTAERVAWRAYDKLFDQFDHLEAAAREKFGKSPYPAVKWGKQEIWSLDEITAHRKRLLSELLEAKVPEGVATARVAADERIVRRRYLANERAIAAWYRKAGLLDMRQTLNRMRREGWKLRNKMAETQPTTIAGAARALQYVGREMKDCDDDWHRAMVLSIANGLSAIEEASQHSAATRRKAA
jgi:hypothetical protein